MTGSRDQWKTVLVLGDGDFVLGLAALIGIAVPLVLFIYGVTLAARHTGQAVVGDGGASLFGAVGVLITAVGCHRAASGCQLAIRRRRCVPGSGPRRWQAATGPLIVIALGLLVCIAAQMLRVMQERVARDADERSRGTHV